jgi:hypothetical protein
MQDNSVLLLIALIAGCITGYTASSKGRSGITWFIIGFLFPLIGLLIALGMKPNEEPR